MRSVKYLIVLMVAVVISVACKKSAAESASLSLERTTLYFNSWQDKTPQTISYTATGATMVAVSSCSAGWNAWVNEATRTITVVAVGANEEGMVEDELSKEGAVVVNALNSDNQPTSYYINVYIASSESLDNDGQELANCYVITEPSVCYTFDVKHRPDGQPLATTGVALLWQSNPGIVKNVTLAGDKVQLYVTHLKNDASSVENTNAVVAAYNVSGEVIWSWHLWIVNDNPLDLYDEYSNGKVFMRHNLGAFTNSNGSLDEQKIHDSYGMYYQWGRKDPFQRPYYFNAAGADNETRYNGINGYIKDQYLERTSANGTVDYVTKYPMDFITNAACMNEGGDGVGDWLLSADNSLWNDTEKSIYDPCPFGWRVPTAQDMLVLSPDPNEGADLNATLRKQYGWHLSDGASTYFWSACGRRRYSDGKVDNMNFKEGAYPSEPQPWEGHYWTSTAKDGKAVSLYFDLTTTRTTVNKFDNAYHDRKANGFQIRCVKM